jgi:cellulose biosynthesis protein BcsQ
MKALIPPEAVRKVRRLLGETQVQFAKRFDVTSLTIARWETGERACAGLYARLVAQLDITGELQRLDSASEGGDLKHNYFLIALFNHKGGVSKTTTTFNLGWSLANKGKRVLMVDADPQCNLTGMTLALSGSTDFESFYKENKKINLYDALRPAFEALPERLKPVECFEVEKRPGLFLLPGHVRISEYDIPLGVAHELTGSFGVMKNLPGAITALIQETAKELNIDYVLADLSPAISSINQNFVMSSSHFIVPCNPDYFCSLAIDSLSEVLPRWAEWPDKAAKSGLFKGSAYPVTTHRPLFLGTINQRFRPRYGAPASAFKMWIDRINERVERRLVPVFNSFGMLMQSDLYDKICVNSEPYNLANISDFNSLIARSQDYNVPIFELTDKQLETVGTVLKNMKKSREEFRKLFRNLADSVILGTENSGFTLSA